MIHPDTELRFVSHAVGHGVFATAAIPRGTLLWVRCHFDRVIPRAEVEAMNADYRAVLERYAYVDSDGDYALCWDLARRLNHSCAPSMRGIGQQFDIAVRDIARGEQITCEYGVLNLSGTLRCQCGAPDCRSYVRGDDVLHLGRAWDAEVAAVLPLARSVAQPLLPFARDPDQFWRWADGTEARPSVLAYHDGAHAVDADVSANPWALRPRRQAGDR
jgi:hypothetical protein